MQHASQHMGIDMGMGMQNEHRHGHGHATKRNGHAAWNGQAAWTWKCSLDVYVQHELGHADNTVDM